MTAGKKGFVLILVLSLMGIFIITVWVLVNLGCGEALQTKKRNDLISANYVAMAGAERMYVYLKSRTDTSVIFPVSRPSETITIDGSVMGSYTARASIVVPSVGGSRGTFGIVSEGIVNGQRATVTVKYGYRSPLSTPLTLGSGNTITLEGAQDPDNSKKKSYATVEGPISYGEGITMGSFANIVGESLNQTFTPVNFWISRPFDTKNTGVIFSDGGTGSVTEAQAIAQAGTNDPTDPVLSTFYVNDVNDDLVIDEKDAFVYYYTVYLNDPACPANITGEDLNISPDDLGEPDCHYYDGDQVFNPRSIPSGTPIIFVNGDVYIERSDTKWWSGDSSHTVVATGNITIVQPKDGSDDTLTLISFGDVITGGKDVGGQIEGNLVVWAKNDFIAQYGGTTNGAIIAENDVIIQTLDGKNKYDRNLNSYKGDWVAPLGLPPEYPTTSTAFRVVNEELGVDGYRPIWQRR